MQDEISWNDNDIYNPYVDISPLEPCDAPKMRKYRPKDDRCTNKQIAKRRKRNKNRALNYALSEFDKRKYGLEATVKIWKHFALRLLF